MTYDFSMTNRQRLIIIAALHQFKLSNGTADHCASIMAEEVDCCAEEHPDNEALAMAGLMEDSLTTDGLVALYI